MVTGAVELGVDHQSNGKVHAAKSSLSDLQARRAFMQRV
jgi:hypothetical protein